jgi:hypothetical protein
MLSELDSAGFWPAGSALARRLAHLSCLGREWLDLERIRGHALSIGWFPPALKELAQVLALAGGPFAVGVWDRESSPTPIVLYKHHEAWAVEDSARIIARVRAQAQEQLAEVRALRGMLPDHPDHRAGEVRHAKGRGPS